MIFLEKPISEYKKFNAFVKINEKFNLPVRCFVWFPKSFHQEEPHVFLYASSESEYQKMKNHLNPKRNKRIALTIPMTSRESSEPCGFHLFKGLYFSNASLSYYAEDWEEGFFKYYWPKDVWSKKNIKSNEKQLVKFFYTPSVLLCSSVSTEAHYNGEIKRLSSHHICMTKNIKKFDIKMFKTDLYIGDNKTFVLEIQPCKPIDSILGFKKRVQPIVEFIFAITSFLERKKLNWHQANFLGIKNAYETYNTRVASASKSMDYPMIDSCQFKEVLEEILKNTDRIQLDYKTKLCLAYVSGLDYSVNSKIVLWNSLLEKVLKQNFQKKNDVWKAEGIKKLGIHTMDIATIKDLIGIRNCIAHGDDISSNRLFQLGQDWELLIERILLAELGWKDFSKTRLQYETGNSVKV